MKIKSIIVLLLMVAGLQTAWAQNGMQLWSNGKLYGIYYLNNVDSIRFIDYMEVWLKGACPKYNVSAIDSVTFSNMCPDDHHPHAIDLGLPSGTKWCCCNVGASKPEEYGGYYAWGETSEKTYYGASTYQYAVVDNQNGNWYDPATDQTYRTTSIGSDIAGTDYDAATVNMGASWRMPSRAQQKELIDNCVRQWIQLIDVNGILVTGPNGARIFLPAGGGRRNSELGSAGSVGYYWSCSLHTNDDDDAYYMNFNTSIWSLYSYFRRYGFCIRPVCVQD